MRALQPKALAQWGWGLVIFGMPWSHAAMSIGTAWVGVCAIIAWWQERFAIKLPPSIGSSPWFWLTLLLGWEAGSLAWSENVEWGFHQLSIQFSLLVLAFAWLKVPLNRERQLQTWVFRSAGLAMAIVLVWGAWRTFDGVDLGSNGPRTSHVRKLLAAWFGVNNRNVRLVYRTGWRAAQDVPSPWCLGGVVALACTYGAVAGASDGITRRLGMIVG